MRYDVRKEYISDEDMEMENINNISEVCYG